MLGMLVAYDEDGKIIATKDFHVLYDETHPDRPPVGLVDWGEMEEHDMPFARRPDRDVPGGWFVPDAVGSAFWPEWLGGAATAFRVELDGKKIRALVHRESGIRRERSAIDAAIAERIEAARGEAADIRDLVGGPMRPLRVDERGVVQRAASPTRDLSRVPIARVQEPKTR